MQKNFRIPEKVLDKTLNERIIRVMEAERSIPSGGFLESGLKGTAMIAIITKLDKAVGGRKYTTEWRVGPRNLLRAVRQYWDDLKSYRDGYGNRGCGATWIEIDGQEIRSDFFPESQNDAALLIQAVQNGSFRRMIDDIEAEDAAYWARQQQKIDEEFREMARNERSRIERGQEEV